MEMTIDNNVIELEKQLCTLIKENKELKKRVKQLEVNLSYAVTSFASVDKNPSMKL